MGALFLSYRRKPVSTAEMGPGFRPDDKAADIVYFSIRTPERFTSVADRRVYGQRPLR
jgi:hypothetical protein